MRKARYVRNTLLRCSALLLILAGGFHLAGQTAEDGYWHTAGKQILNASGKPVRIAGVNWFGMETSTYAPHGLWARNYKEMLDQMKGIGFNTVRLPFSNQLFDSESIPNGIDYTRNPELEGLNGLEIMDRIITHAGRIGLKVVLDRHRPDAGGQSQLWYTSAHSEARWIADWRMLAARYKGDATVIGFDLHNEPRSPACWGCGEASLDWRLAAQRAGNAILEVNPSLLIIVEGVELHANDAYWWGGNLKGAKDSPVLLQVANRLVYSAHDYPPSLYPQPWFSAPDYPANLPSVWDSYWGYISRTELAPVLMGEFGSRLQTESDSKWFDSLTQYLYDNEIPWLFWSWNPNSQDTHGLLLDDWYTVDQRKLEKLQRIMPATAGEGGTATPPAPGKPEQPAPSTPTTAADGTTFCRATFRIFSDWGSGYVADLHVTNEGAGPVNGWTVTWEFAGNQNVREMWNARLTSSDNKTAAQDAGWNAAVPEKSTTYLGFTVDYSGEHSGLQNVTFNGFPCSLDRE